MIVLLLLAACRGAEGKRAGGAMPSSAPVAPTLAASPVIVTTAAPLAAFPDNCRPDEVEQLVADFVAAFNDGDQDALARFFPARDRPTNGDMLDPTYLRWYSVGDRGPDGRQRVFVARTRAPLLAYFAERHQQRERLQLHSLGVTPPDADGPVAYRETVSVLFTLTRRADDLFAVPSGSALESRGKGGIHCPTRTIFLWSM